MTDDPWLEAERVTTLPWCWCVVANFTREPHPEGDSGPMRLGSRYFAPGAKLYVRPTQWGDGGERVTVVGRHRGGRRFVNVVVASKRLCDWRVKQVFNPKALAALGGAWDDSEISRSKAEGMVSNRALSNARPQPEADRVTLTPHKLFATLYVTPEWAADSVINAGALFRLLDDLHSCDRPVLVEAPEPLSGLCERCQQERNDTDWFGSLKGELEICSDCWSDTAMEE